MKRPILAIAVALFVSACGGCKKKEPEAPASPLGYLPQQASLVVEIPDLARLGETVAALEKTRLSQLGAALAGAKDSEELVRPPIRELGFDPRTAAGFRDAGIDGSRGLALAQEGDARLVVLGVADEAKLSGWLGKLATRLGAPVRGEQSFRESPEAPESKVTTFATEGGEVKAAFGLREGHALVATGEGAVAAVGRALQRSWQQSLQNEPTYRRYRGRLGERSVVVWMPEGTRRFPDGVALGVTASEKGLNLRALLPQGPLKLAALEPAGKPAGQQLVSWLPAENFLALRLGGEPMALRPLLEAMLPRGFLSRLKRAGIDLESEVLANLQPGVVVGISLNPDIDLSGGLPQDASISRTNPFDYVDAVIYAKVRDREKAQAVMEKLAAGASHFRFEVETVQHEEGKRYAARYAAGDGMRWGLSGDALVAVGGRQTFDDARARIGSTSGFSPRDPAAKEVFEKSGSAAHLDMPRLAKALSAIPESAYGIGGFRLKAIMDTWVELLGEVRGVTASFSVDDAGLVVDADLGLE